MDVTVHVQTVKFLLSARTSLHGTKMAVAREPFEFSLWSTSSEHYMERNESSSPTLPIVFDIRCEIGKTSDYCSCPVYSLQCQISQSVCTFACDTYAAILALQCTHMREADLPNQGHNVEDTQSSPLYMSSKDRPHWATVHPARSSAVRGSSESQFDESMADLQQPISRCAIAKTTHFEHILSSSCRFTNWVIQDAGCPDPCLPSE